MRSGFGYQKMSPIQMENNFPNIGHFHRNIRIVKIENITICFFQIK